MDYLIEPPVDVRAERVSGWVDELSIREVVKTLLQYGVEIRHECKSRESMVETLEDILYWDEEF